MLGFPVNQTCIINTYRNINVLKGLVLSSHFLQFAPGPGLSVSVHIAISHPETLCYLCGSLSPYFRNADRVQIHRASCHHGDPSAFTCLRKGVSDCCVATKVFLYVRYMIQRNYKIGPKYPPLFPAKKLYFSSLAVCHYLLIAHFFAFICALFVSILPF